MRVALDVSARHRPGHDRGIGRYLDAVTRANGVLGHEVIELSRRMGDGRASEFVALAGRRAALSQTSCDLYHAPTAYYSAGGGRRPTVVSILDLIPLEVPGHRRTGVKARVFHRLAARADAILTLSAHTAGRVAEVLSVPAERIFTASLAPAEVFTPVGPATEMASGAYAAAMVDLRTQDPRKRPQWIEQIARGLEPAGIGLVVAGAGTERLSERGLVGMGRIPDEEWAAVLRGASVFVYTSAYEGQGLPPLEAIACGTPVVAMDNSAMPEVVGPAGSLLPEEQDAEAPSRIVDEVRRLVADTAALGALERACAAQASRFSTARFVDGLDAAYRHAIERAP